VTTTFALGALVLSGVLASVTYLSVRSSVIGQQESSLTHEAIASAESLRGAIQVPNADYPQALASFDTARGSESLLESAGQWYPSSPTLQRSVLPSTLTSLVLHGRLAEQIITIRGTPELIVGIPINTAHGPAGYFQLFNLSEVQGTLRTLFGSLVLAAIVTTLGGAVVGRWGASRALRPLHQTAQAALSIAEGRLGTRLQSDAYADLAEYARRTTEMDDARRLSNAAALRVKFEMYVKDQEIERARSEAAAARLEVSRKALERNLVALSAILLVCTVLSSTWLWRRRKQTDDIRRAAEDRLALIGRFTGGVAHEFNNLMTVIQQAVGLLAQRPMVSTDAAARSLVTEIQQASNVCADVTTQLLSFARQQNLKPETFNVDEFLTGISSMLEIVAGPAIKLKVLVDKSALAIHADRRQFTAVLRNLVSNARDAMGEGGTLTIRVIVDSDNFVRIDLVDEGHGMSVQTLEHAVEPFFTTKPVGAGSGLGLSVADGFMRQSGGVMTLSSTPQSGTTVSLRFPRARQTP